MLPLHAHGYLSGLSASAGFLQILHTSSSSSSYFAAATAIEDDEDVAIGSPSWEEQDEDDAVLMLSGSSVTGVAKSMETNQSGSIQARCAIVYCILRVKPVRRSPSFENGNEITQLSSPNYPYSVRQSNGCALIWYLNYA